MKLMLRSSIALLSSLALVLAPQMGFADSSSVGDPGQSWSIPNDADRGMHVQQFIDSSPGESSSFLLDNGLREDKMVDPTCKSVSDERCTSDQLQYAAILPTCGPLSSVYCVEEFGVLNQDGTKSAAKFSRYFPSKALNEFEASPAVRLPFGGTGTIFDLPEAAHAGGNSYYLSVFTEGGISKGSNAYLSNFSIRLNPVQLRSGDGAIQEIDTGWSKETSGGSGHAIGEWRQAGFGFSGASFCVAGSALERLCAQRFAFPAGKKFYVKVRLQNQPAGWMHGRIYNPDVSITNSGEYFTLDVSAFPVAVPTVYKVYRYPDMPQTLKNEYDFRTGLYKPLADQLSEAEKQRYVTGGCGRSACSEDPLTRNVINSPGPSDYYGIDQLKLWLPFVEDQATALLGTWSMRTLNSNELQGASQCFTNGDKGVTGIVTTNATQYSAGPPSFNKSEGTLEYKVAAPHFTPKKEEFLGTYDLLMRSDVARCVYGFTEAPIRASLSIVSNGADQRVETEALDERNGWVFLSANNFTFSDPTIKVKLIQDPPPPAPTPTPTPSPVVVDAGSSGSEKVVTPSVKKRTSITCVKGATKKKVTAIKPKCPKGYKKA